MTVSPFPTPPRTPELPQRTRENIAACRAVDVDYWCESPFPNVVWAVDADQDVCQVRVDRRNTTAHLRLRDSTASDYFFERSSAPFSVPSTSYLLNLDIA